MTRRSPKIKHEPITFTDAPEVQALASRLIDAHHDHLAEARIKYLFRSGTWNKLKRETWGTAEKVGPKWKHLTNFDFVITINRQIWTQHEVMKPDVLEALVDHELQHCCKTEDKEGNPVFYIQGHDVEDFVSVVRRYGLWSNTLVAMHRAGKEFQQMVMEFAADSIVAATDRLVAGQNVQVVVEPEKELKQAVGR